MSPLAEIISISNKNVLPMNQAVEVTLINGDKVQAISTPKGGFLRSMEQPPQPDKVLQAGEFVVLNNGSLLVASNLESPQGAPNPLIDGAV
jgi:hypothetical protein